MKKYKDLLSELPSKSVVVTYGQFNPPSTGHELLIKVVRKLAKQRKADHIVFVSSKQDKKNPLEISKKIQYLELMFPNTKFVPATDDVDCIGSLKKYKTVVMVTSADSVSAYTKLLKRGNFETTEVVKAGQTDPDSDDKLVKLANKGEYQSFKAALPTTVRELDGKRLMNDIRIGLNLEPIKEQINLVKDEIREQYFRGEIFNEGDIVESDNEVYKIIKRGSNHLLLQTEQGLKVSKWVQDVQQTEREFMLDENLQESVSTMAGGADKALDKAKDDSEKAMLMAKQAKEKARLVDNQKKQMDTLNTNLQKEDSPVVNKNSKYNIAKSVMSLADFRKSMSQAKPEGDAEEKAMVDSVHDGLVGNSHLHTDHSMRHRKVKYHLGEGNGYDDNRTGFAKKPREDDEGYSKPKFKPKSMLDRPHTVHIDGKPWKKFDNGHQAHAAAKTLQAKGKKATAIAHFKEETEVCPVCNKNPCWCDDSHGFIEEARQSAAAKLQKAFQREQEKTASERKAGEELLKKPVKEETDEQAGTRKAQLKRFKAQAVDAKLGCDIKEAVKPAKPKTKTVDVDKVHTAGQEPHEEKFENFKEEFGMEEDELVGLVEADLDNLGEEEFYEAYDDEELAIIDDETGEEIDTIDSDAPALMEVLSRQERIKAKARMRRSQSKRERREKVALRQFSSQQVANKRARRMAVSALKKRLLRGQKQSTITVGQKERVERFIQQRRKIVDRLAARMVSRVKNVEKARMSHKKFTKPMGAV